MPSKPRYFTYSSMAFFPLLSIRCLYSGNWYQYLQHLDHYLQSYDFLHYLHYQEDY
ncbi:hypothetical protein [Wolbachia endosymbiont (group B) of Gerris lacustris]|uniref:hypothetical protein n=1 Tax=Wolbachia endosymbiont (group B) of Gerris lacustris TaxID=3066159 RepID=UPI00333F438A